MRRMLRLVFFLLCFASLERFCHEKTHGFRIYKITSNIPFRPDWVTPPLAADAVEHFFSQPYHFLGSGGESYAFISEDRKYVLKFFKHHHMRDSLIPFLNASKEKKREAFFASCLIAESRFKERSGLIYLHLNPTENQLCKIKIYDPIGVVHTLDLDTLTFALQKRASMAYPTIESLTSSGELDAAKLRLHSLLDLILERGKSGIANHDARARNFGFVHEHAIEFDLGAFAENASLLDEKTQKKIFLLETSKLRRWVHKHCPELSEDLEENILKRLD